MMENLKLSILGVGDTYNVCYIYMNNNFKNVRGSQLLFQPGFQFLKNSSFYPPE